MITGHQRIKMLLGTIPLNFIREKLLKISREGLWVFVGQAGMAAAGLIGVKILTHVLNPAEYGRLAIANTLVALIGVNLFGPLGQGFMRYWAISKAKGELGEFYYISNQYAKYSIYIVSVLAVISCIILGVLKNVDWAVLLIISLIVGSVTGWFSLRISIFTAMRRRRLIALLKVAQQLSRPLFAAFLALIIAPKAGYALAGYFLAAFLMMMVAESVYRRMVSTSSDSFENYSALSMRRGLARDILKFSWPFLAWGIFGWMHTSCSRWAIQTYHGADVVGAFAVVSLLAVYPISFGAGFLGTLITPIAYQRAGDLSSARSVAFANRILAAVTGIYIAGAIIIISIFALFHYQLVLLVSNINFVSLSYLLPGLTAAWALFHLGQMLSAFGMVANKPRNYILPKIISSIIAVAGTFYLSARIGPTGVVWGLVAAGLVYALWCFMIAAKVVGGHRMLFHLRNSGV